jgi:CRP/FNR family transcriptional regulator, dissimilatory nitrate respiration regulator
MIPLAKHPERNIIRLPLRRNVMLTAMDEAECGELEPMLSIVDRAKGDYLLQQGVHEMEQ